MVSVFLFGVIIGWIAGAIIQHLLETGGDDK